MIVRAAGSHLHLITQPDHAALARRIMDHWPPLQRAERRASIVLAIEEHDNGWREPDSAPAVDPATGRIFDFISAPASVRQGVWPRGVARLAQQDSWAAALVAQHALTVYDRYRGDDDWLAFFDELEATRARLVPVAARSLDLLIDDYQYVRIGDLLSLVFCNQWREEQSFGRWRFQLEADTIVVTPDPFGGRAVPIEIAAREIPDRVYQSDRELQDAIRVAPVRTLAGLVS